MLAFVMSFENCPVPWTHDYRPVVSGGFMFGLLVIEEVLGCESDRYLCARDGRLRRFVYRRVSLTYEHRATRRLRARFPEIKAGTHRNHLLRTPLVADSVVRTQQKKIFDEISSAWMGRVAYSDCTLTVVPDQGTTVR